MTKLMIKNIYEKKANDLQFPQYQTLYKKNKEKNPYVDGNRGTKK